MCHSVFQECGQETVTVPSGAKRPARKSRTLAKANHYGNIDVRVRLPQLYSHVRGKRLSPLCAKLGIKCAKALVGFVGKKRYGYKPQFDGVVVSKRSAAKLREAIVQREARNSSPAAKARREAKAEVRRRQEEARRAELFALGIDPEGRTARLLRRGEIDKDQAELMGFIAEVRHEHTDYEELLDEARSMGLRGEEVRAFARSEKQMRTCPDTWEKFLGVYGLDSPEAKALAAVLIDPKQCHPVWFKEAELAVRRYGLDLSALSYERISKVIASWREDRGRE